MSAALIGHACFERLVLTHNFVSNSDYHNLNLPGGAETCSLVHQGTN